MKLIVFSSAPIVKINDRLFMYSPYEKEMEIWAKHSDEIQFCCPVWNEDRGLLLSQIQFSTLENIILSEFNVKNFKSAFYSVKVILKNIIIIFKAMQQADHIHLRCPGNIGLLACVVQILFPSKTKTAKYAGNWDPKSKQPLSYCLQKWILSNTFLTKKMKVLVYGKWPNSSPNILPFFTASYSENEEKTAIKSVKPNGEIRMLFVGTLVGGKNPLYAVQLLEQLRHNNLNIHLDIFGEGPQRSLLQDYIEMQKLSDCVFLHGNQNQQVLKKAYRESHFVVLASKSEGWPKAIAEGMFWGCVPLATAVSCVSYMLDYGNRGVLLQMDLKHDSDVVYELIRQAVIFEEKSKAAMEWSRKYTIEYFGTEIKKLLR
ncbi:glycosyltransferase [Flavobacterium flavipallidum]|uniref:Glycosyltransferase n=1 Tax=Flavobacterium flavipallidum TaxID=3139140 RepID=A0ABU9HJ66_9FLAO